MAVNIHIVGLELCRMISFTGNNSKCVFTYGKAGLLFGSAALFNRAGLDVTLEASSFSKPIVIDCADGLDSCTKQYQSSFDESGFTITRQVAFDPDIPERFRVRLIFKNNSGADIRLLKLSPILAGKDDIKLGKIPSSEWMFYRQGRHKNDVPSVCTLGVKDDRFRDAAGSMAESGGGMGNVRIASSLTSDQLTVLRAPSSDGKEGINLLIGFLTCCSQLFECVIRLDSDGNLATLAAGCLFNTVLPSGGEAACEWVRIDCDEDIFKAIGCYARDKALFYNARKSVVPPSVYLTWFHYGSTVTYDDIIVELEALKDRKIPFDVFQIDEGWEEELGEWLSNGKFPLGMKHTADRIRSYGFRPGIWTSPFVVWTGGNTAAKHPDWLLRNKDGTMCTFKWRKDYYVLDITNPEVLDWVEQLYRTLARDWGYEYHKLDFTRAPAECRNAVFYNQYITIAQAYRNAFEVIRRGAGEGAFINICGGLYDPVIGVVDSQVTCSDALGMWELTAIKGKAAPFTIKQNLMRYWMNSLWDNNPSAMLVRRQKETVREQNLSLGLFNDEEVKTVALNQYFGGGMVVSTEPFCDISDDRLFLLRHVMPVIKVRTVPRDLFSGSRCPAVIDCEVTGKTGKVWHTVTVINWSDSDDIDASLAIGRETLGNYAFEHDSFIVSEFFSGRLDYGLRPGDVFHAGVIKPHGSAHFKVMPSSGLPAVMHSDGHFSMGGEVSKLQVAGDNLVFETEWLFNCPLTYRIKLQDNMTADPAGLPANITTDSGFLVIKLLGSGHYSQSILLIRKL